METGKTVQRQHLSGGSVENLNRKMEQYLTGGIRDRESFTTRKPSIRPACAYTQASRSGESCRGVFAFSAVDLQEATNESSIRVAEYCLVTDLWPLLLSAFAEDRGCEHGDECVGRTIRSSESEGGCFGGFRRRNEGYHGLTPVEALWPRGDRQLSEVVL